MLGISCSSVLYLPPYIRRERGELLSLHEFSDKSMILPLFVKIGEIDKTCLYPPPMLYSIHWDLSRSGCPLNLMLC